MRGWAAGVLEKDRELAVSGPYACTRNPLYLGSFIIGAGGIIAGGTPWFGLLFLAFFAWMYGSTMKRESRALADRFGPAYLHYRDSVPVFVPRPGRYRPSPDHELPTRTFSVRRYLRNREYEALLGALAAFGLLALKAGDWGALGR
ncbi:MAG: isoprenylcysteine carboxylmethyltransferase family protein [Gemmatimonadota bacterium]|nr:isoprenylcysteine carboxylmethyltransferase family protein [Gemmatimonadota bacterium]